MDQNGSSEIIIFLTCEESSNVFLGGSILFKVKLDTLEFWLVSSVCVSELKVCFETLDLDNFFLNFLFTFLKSFLD